MFSLVTVILNIIYISGRSEFNLWGSDAIAFLLDNMVSYGIVSCIMVFFSSLCRLLSLLGIQRKFTFGLPNQAQKVLGKVIR